MSRSAAPSLPGIGIADILRGVWRRKLMVLLLTLISFGIAFAFVKTSKPRYATEARVVVENLDTPFDRVGGLETNRQEAIDERDVASQIAVITSQDLGERVANALKLPERDEFDPLRSKGQGMVGQLKVTLGFSTDPQSLTPLQRTMDRYLDELNVYPVPDSNVIAIKYSSTVPTTAAEIANTLAETYVMSTREAQSAPTGRAREWLGEQIEKLRLKVVESESAVERFRAEKGLIRGTNATLNVEELSEINKQIATAESERSTAEAKSKSIRALLNDTGSVDANSDVLASQLIQRLQEQQALALRTLTELSVTYLPSHPKMQAAQKSLANVEKQIRREALKIASGLEEQARIAGAREDSLRANLDELKTKAGDQNEDEVTLRALEREAAANRSLLESMLTRFTDASARDDLVAQPGKARIIQRAPIPTAVAFPKSGPTVALATLAGFVLSLGMAFFLEVMAAAVRQTVQADTATQAPAAALRQQPPIAAAGPPSPQPAVAQAAVAQPAPPPSGGGGGRTDTARALANTLNAALGAKPQAQQHAQQQPQPQPLPQVAQAAPAAMPKAANQAAANAPPAIAALPPPAQPAEASPETPADSSMLCDLPASGELTAALAHVAEVGGPGAFADATRRIASWAYAARQTHNARRIGLCSIEPQSLDMAATAAAVARELAAQDLRVIAVDLSTSPSALDPVFGAEAGPGIAELVQGQASFSETIVRDRASNVQYLRAGIDVASLSTQSSYHRIDMVLSALDSAYDFIIVNCDVVSGPTGAMIKKCHAALVIAPPRNIVATARVVQDLRQAGLKAVQYVRTSEAAAPAQRQMSAA